jgi:hypothetical protein
MDLETEETGSQESSNEESESESDDETGGMNTDGWE